MSSNPKNHQRTTKEHKNFKEMIKDETPMDQVPDEDLKEEEREIKKGHQSKNNSSSEKRYNQNMRP